jgi:hypothetical protein
MSLTGPVNQAVSFSAYPKGHPILIYFYNARYLILALIGLWSLAGWKWRGRWSRYELAAVAFAIMLVFAGGFGVQYTVTLLPLLFATRPKFAATYGVVAGAFIGAAYLLTWDGGTPLYSFFKDVFPMPAALIGFGVWTMLAEFTWSTVRRPAVAVTTPRAA